jgi:hypothetical protein
MFNWRNNFAGARCYEHFINLRDRSKEHRDCVVYHSSSSVTISSFVAAS